ncbi:hypothetical protein ACFZBU_15235 [Embleya sp. NPDC008237]|uniref:hypothetical protein n=1 Tax=Embleya sp. NPDC008237 TaxID=3363978 RepID=UPI0036F0D5EA
MANATDDRSPGDRAAGFDLELAAPAALGMRPTELDLRTFFDRPPAEVAAVLDHAVVPHIDSPGHPETELLAAVAADYRARGVPHRTLRDGQVLVIDGARISIR